jgi:hypothetical protein
VQALREAAENYPQPLGKVAGAVMGFAVSPLGGITRPYRPPGDQLTKDVSDNMTTLTGVHQLFRQHVYVT